MSKPYHEYPNCGAHLDHGEHCDCKDRWQEPDPAAQSAGQPETGASPYSCPAHRGTL